MAAAAEATPAAPAAPPLPAAAGPNSWAVPLVVALSTLANLVWVLRDHTAPSWDQGHYLWVTAVYQQALDHHGPLGLLRAVYDTDPSHAPLFTLAMLPFAYVFGPSTVMGLALNLVEWPVLLLATGGIAARLFGERARLAAILFVLPLALVVQLAHNDLQDFTLLVLTVLVVLMLLRCRRFEATGAALGLGALMALGSLAKFSFALGIAGPFAVTVAAAALGWRAQRRRDGDWHAARVPARNLGLSLLVAAVPFAVWYAPNWTPTAAYLKIQYSPMAGSISDPLAPAHVLEWAIGTAADVSWWSLGLALVLAVCAAPALVRRLARPAGSRRRAVFALAFAGSWFLLPLVVLASNVNQDPRYAIASYPALAVLVGGMVARGLGHRGASVAVGALVAVAVLQVLQVDAPSVVAPLRPVSFSVTTSYGVLGMSAAGPDGPAAPPTPTNVTLTVVKALESTLRGPDRRRIPSTVVILEDETYVNGNDLSFYAYVRHDPWTFVALDSGTRGAALMAQLAKARAVLYVRQAPLRVSAADGRVGQINVGASARAMTPAMFARFEPHPRRIRIGSEVGQSPYLSILVPRPAPPARPAAA